MISKRILLITFINEPKLILLHTVKWFQVWLCIANNSIKHHSFVYTHLNDETVLFQTIQFSISHLLAHSFNVKQFYLTQRSDPIRCYHSEPEWSWEQWQWRDTLHSPKLQHYWSLTIRLLSVISCTLVAGGDAVSFFYNLIRLSDYIWGKMRAHHFSHSASWNHLIQF